MRTAQLAAVLIAALVSSAASAQGAPVLKVPDASPAASVSQTVGLTRIVVDYHRPAVNGRKIWGALVPYGEVWRAGANENTTFTTSSPIKVGGKALAAGTYGLHMLPTAKDWTFILSKMSTGWGSFSYDAKEDALRVVVHPTAAAESEERLSYRFDDVTDKSATLTLRWEKLAVPVRIDVDTPAVVMSSMRGELRGLAQFFWEPWAQAATYWLQNGGNLDEAKRFTDKSLGFGEHFRSLRASAAIAEKKGDAKKAEALRAKALSIAAEGELNQFGYALLGQKKYDEAISVFRHNVEQHPQSWNAYDSLAEAYLNKGDKSAALDNYTRALALVKEPANKKRIAETVARLKQ
jgi:tetratricopeptide (TPR) repeat protein